MLCSQVLCVPICAVFRLRLRELGILPGLDFILFLLNAPAITAFAMFFQWDAGGSNQCLAIKRQHPGYSPPTLPVFMFCWPREKSAQLINNDL